MNSLDGRKNSSSFQWTAICASVSFCLPFDAFAFSFGRAVATAATPLRRINSMFTQNEEQLDAGKLHSIGNGACPLKMMLPQGRRGHSPQPRYFIRPTSAPT